MFKPVLNITEQIAEYLADQIIFDELPGGTRIQEVKVAKSLDVSRGSIREALLILERKHLIEIVPRRGAVVNDLDRSDALELIDVFSMLSQRWLLELIKHPGLAEVLDNEKDIIRSMEDAARADDPRQMLKARASYHVESLAPAGRYLVAVFESLLPTSQRLMYRLVRDTDLDLYDLARLYKALHTALEDRSEERVSELVSAFHLRLRKLSEKVFSEGTRSNVRSIVSAPGAPNGKKTAA